jgi:hypothetical protein
MMMSATQMRRLYEYASDSEAGVAGEQIQGNLEGNWGRIK